VLSARERAILEARMLTDEPKTLDDLAREYRVSRERIRQIEQRAFERLKAAVRTRLDNSLPPATRDRNQQEAKPASAGQRVLENSCG
jgi:RNA polymerase sigma-32 factor